MENNFDHLSALSLAGDPQVVYVPSLGMSSRFSSGGRKTVADLIKALVDGALGVGCVFKRLDTGEGNYLRELQVGRHQSSSWHLHEAPAPDLVLHTDEL
jgi:hypothetical protein